MCRRERVRKRDGGKGDNMGEAATGDVIKAQKEGYKKKRRQEGVIATDRLRQRRGCAG